MSVKAADDLRLLEIDLATLFVLTSAGRIRRQNDPDGSPAPRLFLAGCPAGYLLAVREDVSGPTAAAMRATVARAPAWRKARATPPRLGRLIEILAHEGEAVSAMPALIYALPGGLAFAHEARIVVGESAAGDALAADLRRRGLPPALGALGFAGVQDFWPPWCAAMEGDQIASLAFAARLGREGAEAGIVTVPQFRARGFAAAATAAWSRLPGLAGRALFYSTQTTNHSSQRVAARLGLRLIGASVSVS